MRRSYSIAALLLTALVAAAQVRPGDLRIETRTLPSGSIGKRYVANLRVVNATFPLAWRLTSGKLPPGLELPEVTGTIGGMPTVPGTYRFRVAVSDATGKTASGDFVIEIQNELAIRWMALQGIPHVNGNKISGAVTVENSSKETFDLTVIIVAVNEYGKAFTLGYEKFDLAQNVEQDIPFESTLPNGRYVVHADAIAEVPAKKLIYRSRQQTDGALVVQVNR